MLKHLAALAVMLGVTFMGCFGTYTGIRQILLARASRQWPTTEGRVTESRVHHAPGTKGDWPWVRYEFAVDGVRHAGRTVVFGQRGSGRLADAEDVVARYPAGAAVRVAYDPAEPASCCLEPGTVRWQSYLLPPLCVAMVLFGATGALGVALFMHEQLRPPEAVLDEEGLEDGFVDLALTVTGDTTAPDGTRSIVARGRLDGARIGLIVDLLPEWKPHDAGRDDRDDRDEDSADDFSDDGVEDAAARFPWGRIRYRSTGRESDAFLAALARLYGMPEEQGPMAKAVEAAAVGLDSEPGDVGDAPVRMKAFFFDEGPAERYAEVYTHIDLAAKRLEFNEKDPEYRRAILRALRDPTRV